MRSSRRWTPRVLFQGGGYRYLGFGGYLATGNYDLAPDGQHFLMIKEQEALPTSKELGLVMRWADELKRRVPPGWK